MTDDKTPRERLIESLNASARLIAELPEWVRDALAPANIFQTRAEREREREREPSSDR